MTKSSIKHQHTAFSPNVGSGGNGGGSAYFDAGISSSRTPSLICCEYAANSS